MDEMNKLWYENAIRGTQPWDGKMEVEYRRAISIGNATVVVTVGGNN